MANTVGPSSSMMWVSCLSCPAEIHISLLLSKVIMFPSVIAMSVCIMVVPVSMVSKFLTMIFVIVAMRCMDQTVLIMIVAMNSMTIVVSIISFMVWMVSKFMVKIWVMSVMAAIVVAFVRMSIHVMLFTIMMMISWFPSNRHYVWVVMILINIVIIWLHLKNKISSLNV